MISFSVSGLGKGDWNELELFFRGAGDMIGATKLDEAILAEMLREEQAAIEVLESVESPLELAPESLDDPGDIMSWSEQEGDE